MKGNKTLMALGLMLVIFIAVIAVKNIPQEQPQPQQETKRTANIPQ